MSIRLYRFRSQPYRLLHLADGGAYARVAEREATCDACAERALAYYRRELQQRAAAAISA